MIRHIQSKAVPESAAPFSQVVMDDTYAYFSGLVAADFPEGQAVLGDVGEETRVVLTAIRSMLEEIGLDMDRIVRTDVHLASLEDFDTMDDAYQEFFEHGHYPARTTTESPRLFHGSRVEITCMARLLLKVTDLLFDFDNLLNMIRRESFYNRSLYLEMKHVISRSFLVG